MKPTIIYVYDMLCSWCFGFEKEMKKLYDQYKETYDFQFISGGMFPPIQNKRIKEVLGANFHEAYARVIEISGAEISEKYLTELVQDTNYRLDSEITARAFSTFKTYPEFKGNEINFIMQFQYNMYHEGLNPNQDEIYLKTAAYFGLAGEEFLQKMKMAEITDDILKDFNYTQALKVTGFPHVFLKTSEEQYYLLTRGYDKEVNIAIRIDSIEKELKMFNKNE